MKKSEKVWPLSVATGALGVIAALTLAAPSAHADPEVTDSAAATAVTGEQSISTQAAPAGDSDPGRPGRRIGDPAPLPQQAIPRRPRPRLPAPRCRSPSPVQSRELASRHHDCSGRTGAGHGNVVSARPLARGADPGHQRHGRATSADAATARPQCHADERASHRSPGAAARGAATWRAAARRRTATADAAAARSGDACRPGAATRTGATPSGPQPPPTP